jgi:hypothetical protein
MRDECSTVVLDRYERGAALEALADKHNQLLKAGQCADAVDDALIKIAHAKPIKRRGGRDGAR